MKLILLGDKSIGQAGPEPETPLEGARGSEVSMLLSQSSSYTSLLHTQWPVRSCDADSDMQTPILGSFNLSS